MFGDFVAEADFAVVLRREADDPARIGF